MDFKFAANQKPEKATAPVQRRQKLVRRIDQQIGYVREMIEGKEQRSSWVWMDEQGRYYVPVKYGRHPLELKKGMFSILCKDLDECEHILCTVRTMVLAGEFDDHLMKATAEIRKRFGR